MNTAVFQTGPGFQGGPGRRATRDEVSLACSDCGVRNYRTTKKRGQTVELKKFCKQCRKHTLHKDTK